MGVAAAAGGLHRSASGRFGVFALLVVSVVSGLVWYGAGQGDSDARQLTVAGSSMQPTLQPGDKVRLQASSENDLQRGDVVAVRFRTRERLMVKRIIALAGDQVEWDDGILRVNGVQLQMDGWPKERRISRRAWKVAGLQLKRYNNRVPAGSLIVMGDNSRKSYDSGDFGILSIRQIAGRVIW